MLPVQLAMEALDRREWPRTETGIHLLQSVMLTAQAIALDMEKAGREDETDCIGRAISDLAPEPRDEAKRRRRSRISGDRLSIWRAEVVSVRRASPQCP